MQVILLLDVYKRQSLHMMGYVKSCTNEIMIEVLSEILGLNEE